MAIPFVVAALAACGSEPAHTRVALYGDSLLYEARASVRSGLRPISAVIDGRPGNAPCDLLPTIRNEVVRLRPEVVVLETAGSNLTPCMGGITVGSEAFIRRYVDDVRAIYRVAHRVRAHVLIIDPPPIGALQTKLDASLLGVDQGLRTALGGLPGLTFGSGPRDSVSDAGGFTATLPCARSESGRPDCVNGRIAVRDPVFGIHFCPVPYKDAAAIQRGCSRYSSGAVRFGRAIVAEVRTLLRRP